MDKVTLAHSSGIAWLFLVTHVSTGLIAIAAGAVALSVAKGGRLHKKSGIVFTVAMISAGLFASVVASFEAKVPSIIGGILTAYLVFTAMTKVKPLARRGRTVDAALMVLAFMLAALQFQGGLVAWGMPGHQSGGIPGGMMFFMGFITLLAAIGDVRMIQAGALRGPRRLARHLWRMCFGLFIATGSFFLGQMKFIPKPIRIVPLLYALALAPLAFLLYWMWRIRLRRRLSGMIIASTPATTATS